MMPFHLPSASPWESQGLPMRILVRLGNCGGADCWQSLQGSAPATIVGFPSYCFVCFPTQRIEVVASETEKKAWLSRHLPVFVDAGEVLVFAGTRAKVEELAAELASQRFRASAIHGDLDPSSRAQVLQAFREGSVHVLVATDVAARGLDIKQLHTVINYDVGKSIESYIHRIGRTGRAGDKEGVAYTLLLPMETAMAGKRRIEFLVLQMQA